MSREGNFVSVSLLLPHSVGYAAGNMVFQEGLSTVCTDESRGESDALCKCHRKRTHHIHSNPNMRVFRSHSETTDVKSLIINLCNDDDNICLCGEHLTNNKCNKIAHDGSTYMYTN